MSDSINGVGSNGSPSDEAVLPTSSAPLPMSTQDLQTELVRTREERDAFEAQYQGLLAKLTGMRNTLGERLRQDAEELDRREAQIEALQAQTTENTTLIETLRGELVSSHADVERLTSALDTARSAAATAVPAVPDRTRELAESAERLRIEAEGWESAHAEERAAREEAELRADAAERAKEEAERRMQDERDRAEREAATARELQAVLEEFQAAQDSELQRALGDYQEKYDGVAKALAEHRERTTAAESQLADFKDAAERCKSLEKEVKEKNLLVGKLRHEAVILNEHLTEALRRLRADTSDSNVDRRLVTNLLLQFLTTPRADAKRFEMLSLIASVLHFTEEQRETAGLQRSSTPGGGRSKTPVGGSKPSGAKSPAASDESFSNLFVEFLLSEADQARPSTSSADSVPNSPKAPAAPSNSGGGGGFNLYSLASLRRPSSDRRASNSSADGRRASNGEVPMSPGAAAMLSPPLDKVEEKRLG